MTFRNLKVLPVLGENLARFGPLEPADLQLVLCPRHLILSWAPHPSQEYKPGFLRARSEGRDKLPASLPPFLYTHSSQRGHTEEVQKAESWESMTGFSKELRYCVWLHTPKTLEHVWEDCSLLLVPSVEPYCWILPTALTDTRKDKEWGSGWQSQNGQV